MAEQKKQELPDTGNLEAHRIYYSTANGICAMTEVLTINAQSRPLASSPHYRAVVGSGLTAGALTELAESDKRIAKHVFDELIAGLLGLGSRLGLNDKARDS